MKKVVSLFISFLFYCCCFSQSSTAYKLYIKNLCACFQKDTSAISSMNDASNVLGKCMNVVNPALRNKAMKEKGIPNTDVPSLIQLEKLFAMDLLKECPSFMATIEKLSSKPKKAVPQLPIADTVAESVCNCLQLKGVASSKSVVIDTFTKCFESSVLDHYDELLKQYKINDNNQEILSSIGELIHKQVVTNCKFYIEKLAPLLKDQ